ncbi:MAG: hypothetical protein AAGC53_17975 [Actinomycetota bacterium]
MPSESSMPPNRAVPSPPGMACCGVVADDLAATGDVALSAETSRLVQQCLRCQAEIATYRRLRRAMRSLAESPRPAAPDLEQQILVALDAVDDRTGSRVPTVAAATLGGLAAAAGVIALAARRRSGLRLAS